MEEEVRFIADLPPTSWLKTLHRLSILKAYEADDHRTAGAAELHARRLGMTTRSFYRLLRAYEEARRAGAAKRPGSGRPRSLPDGVDRFIDETITRFGREVPDRAVYLEVERLCRGAGIEPPSYKAVRERISPSSVDLRIRLGRRADVVLDVCPLDLNVTTEDQREADAHLAHLSALTGTLTRVDALFVNLADFRTSGMDLEASYRTKLAGGSLSLRALANHTIKFEQQTLTTRLVSTDTQVNPRWAGDVNVAYEKGGSDVFLGATYRGPGRINANFTRDAIANNYTDSVIYVTTSVGHVFEQNGRRLSLRFSVNNLFDRKPPYGYPAVVFGDTYDRVGRYFKVSVRYSM